MNYKKVIQYSFFGVVALLLCFSAVAQKPVTAKNLKAITSEKVKAHIDYLASDALLGRNTPSPGLDTAAAYIAKEFYRYGLQPVNGSYFNEVPLVITSLGDDNSVEITRNGETKMLTIKTEFVPYDFTASATVEGSLVFAGYGITAPEYNYDDYANIDVKGKIVVVMRHEPGESDTASLFDGKNSTKYSYNENKIENAIAHGAVGMLVVTDPLNHQMINPRGFPWPSLSKIIPKDALAMELEDSQKLRIPAIHVGKEIMNLLFGSVDSLKRLQAEIDKSLKPLSRHYPEISVRMKVTTIQTPVKSNNVIGLLPGTDPIQKNEYLVIGAHYDHVGFNREHKEGEDYINNGADDNASGTAGVLAVAEAFSKMKNRPKRSVLYMAFSGEEKGLFGSQAYARNPLFPMENTVAMLNMDMISRNDPDSLCLEGASLCPDLVDIVKTENKGIGFKLQLNEDNHVGGSDHASFYKKDVPFLFFFAGLHNDYHTVRDNPNTINPDKTARIAQLVYKTAWHIANENKRYTIVKKK